MAAKNVRRPLTKPEADALWTLLVTAGGAREEGREEFAKYITRKATSFWEYRFQGHLGFGGKLYYDGETLRVGAYPENETAKIRRAVATINQELVKMSKRADEFDCEWCGGTDDDEPEHTQDCQRPGFSLGLRATPDNAEPSTESDMPVHHISLIHEGRPGPSLCGLVPAGGLTDDSAYWSNPNISNCRKCRAAKKVLDKP